MFFCLALVACGGLFRRTEEPAFRSIAHFANVEVRQYGARIAAETLVDGDADAARKAGTRRLADFVSGANAAGEKIGLTAPVAQSSEGPGHWRLRLFMPAAATLATLPRPSDPVVALAQVAPETLAVLRFSGAAGADIVAARTGELVAALEGSAWRPAGAPVAWFYEASRRRTEVAIPVSPM